MSKKFESPNQVRCPRCYAIKTDDVLASLWRRADRAMAKYPYKCSVCGKGFILELYNVANTFYSMVSPPLYEPPPE